MAKHTKPGSGSQHPNTNGKSTGNHETSVSGNVHVRGEISIERGPKESLAREAAEGKQDTKDRKKRWLELATFWVVTFYASVTFIQAVLTFKALTTQRDQLEAQREQFRLERRPYIRTVIQITNTDTIPGPDGRYPSAVTGRPLDAEIGYENIGKSAALHFRMSRYINFGSGAEEKVKSARKEPENDGLPILLPNDPHHTSALTLKSQDPQRAFISKEELIPWDGTKPIFVYGNIYFSDTSGQRYCDPYGIMLLDSGAQLNIDAENISNCIDPDNVQR